MEFVPLALACGHLVKGTASFRWVFDGGKHSVVACPEGCGWQAWVAEPTHDEQRRCLCPPGLPHVCGTYGFGVLEP